MAYKRFRRNGTKYNAHKVTIDGITFDSKHEAERYCQLKLLQRAGAISDLELQKEFELIPNQYRYEKRYGKNGKRLKDKQILAERKIVYVADFSYIDNETGDRVVEDAKSEITRINKDYVIKRKLMRYIHGIEIQEV